MQDAATQRLLLVIVMCWVGATAVHAQRVSIPQSASGDFGTSDYGSSVYGSGSAAQGQATFGPGSGAPSYGAPPQNTNVLPPPTFDPYTGSVTPGGAPPPSVPYNYSQPAPPAGGSQWPPPGQVTPYGQSGAAPPPAAWDPGTYGAPAGGTMVSFQKFLQELSVEYTYLYGDHSNDALEISRLELSSTFAIPVMGNIDQPLLLTPGFAFNWLEGPIGDPNATPRGPDLPPQLYDAYLDAAWYPKPLEWLSGELGVRTGVWTDFNNVGSDAVRILGRGLGVISISPRFEVLLGVVYLDRVRIKLLPAGGVRYTPNEDLDVYIVFPNPKIRGRMYSMGSTDWWWFVAGEYGGGSWAVDRVGLDDRIDINDLRLSLGLEWQTLTQARGHMEIGYVFDREVLFTSRNPVEFKPNDTVMFRVGIDF